MAHAVLSLPSWRWVARQSAAMQTHTPALWSGDEAKANATQYVYSCMYFPCFVWTPTTVSVCLVLRLRTREKKNWLHKTFIVFIIEENLENKENSSFEWVVGVKGIKRSLVSWMSPVPFIQNLHWMTEYLFLSSMFRLFIFFPTLFSTDIMCT